MTHEEMMQRGGIRREGAATIERLDPRLLTGDPTYIFNIYDQDHLPDPGVGGKYYIPPCPEGKPWVRAPKPIPGTVEDTYAHFTDREEYRVRALPGEDVVNAILGVENPNTDLRRWGVFASKSSSPTKDEMAEAKKRLVAELQKTIRQADQYFASADPKDKKNLESDHFYKAARYLNVKKPWMSDSQQMTVCPFCSVGVSPTASVCHGCNNVINQAAYEAVKKQIAGTV